MEAVVGISDHIGRAELVTLAWEDDSVRVLSRRRAGLVDAELPSAPYHHQALVMPLAEAEALITRVRASVTRHCRELIAQLIADHSVGTAVLQQSPHPGLPGSLAEILSSWPLTCAADGMMYRELLADCARERGLEVVRSPRRIDAMAEAARALSMPRARIVEMLKDLGKQVGVPWRKEHQAAAALALAQLGSHRLGKGGLDR